MTAIAKRESIFIFPVMYLAGLVFINRNSVKGRKKLNEAMGMLKKDNVKLWIFPEGNFNLVNTGAYPEIFRGIYEWENL